MKKILTVSLFAMMAVSAANADIASTKYVDDIAKTKQASLGFTPENVANKVTSVTSASTNTQYPSAQAVFQYVSGQIGTVNNNNNSLKLRVDGLEATTAALDEDKQDNLTATGSANRPVYAAAGGVAAVTGVSIPVGAAETTSTAETAWASIWVE